MLVSSVGADGEGGAAAAAVGVCAGAGAGGEDMLGGLLGGGAGLDDEGMVLGCSLCEDGAGGVAGG